jgi:hypothetical protein
MTLARPVLIIKNIKHQLAGIQRAFMARNSSRISRRLAIHCGAVAAVLEGLLPLGVPRDVRLASGTRLFGISTGQSVTPFAAQPALAPVHSQRTAVGAAAVRALKQR